MNKESLKTFFSAAVTFGIIMGLFYGIFNGIYSGILFGIISGLLFGIGISSFVQTQKKKFKKVASEVISDKKINLDKKITMDGGANHFKGGVAVGGWLYLTSEDLIFKSHRRTFKPHETVIPLETIVDVKTKSILGFIPNGLQIIINNDITEKFVVNNRKTWIKKINDARDCDLH